jgi:hypothetical protein
MGKEVLSRKSLLVIAGAAVVLVWPAVASGQSVKATVVSTVLERTTPAQWIQELEYKPDQIYPLGVDRLGCPLIEASVSGVKLLLMLDSGTARGFLLTNHAPPVPHSTVARNEELNADGTHRGDSFEIRLANMRVLGKVFENVAGSLSDWRMYSSDPFDGTVGLDFFLDRRVTLDYRSAKVAVTALPLPLKFAPARYVSLDLLDAPKSQGHVLYARARVNGRDTVVYFDTGYNMSFIDPQFADGLPQVERPGRFKIFRQQVLVELDGHRFLLNDLREDAIRRGTAFDVPVGLVLGSDILSQFIVTIDLRAKKLILAAARLPVSTTEGTTK